MNNLDRPDLIKYYNSLGFISKIEDKKDLYDVNRILEWVEWFKDLGGVQYLDKPTPPFPPQKIIIRK